MGYGQSLIDGFNYSIENNYQFAITMDSDGQHEPENITRFINVIQDSTIDILSGSRYLVPGRMVSKPPIERYHINKKITELINRITGYQLTDSFCGFKIYRVDAHPDHIAASRLCDAARFYGKLTKTSMAGDPFYVPRMYYYFVSHLRLNVSPSFILDISQQIEQKLAALQCYQSQFGSILKKHPGSTWIIRANAYWGGLIRRDYGEAFMSKECIGLRKIRDLL